MDLVHMRTMYDVGRLSDAMIIASNSHNAWHVDCHDLWGHTLHLTTEDGSSCYYETLDKATAAAKSIGFQQVAVVEH